MTISKKDRILSLKINLYTFLKHYKLKIFLMNKVRVILNPLPY